MASGHYTFVSWASEEEKAKAIAENSVWTLQWYPMTPVGFCQVGASTLKECINAALKKPSAMTLLEESRDA